MSKPSPTPLNARGSGGNRGYSPVWTGILVLVVFPALVTAFVLL